MGGSPADNAVEEVAAAGSLADSRSSCTLPCHCNCCTIGLGHHSALEEQQAVPGPAGSSSPRSL